MKKAKQFKLSDKTIAALDRARDIHTIDVIQRGSSGSRVEWDDVLYVLAREYLRQHEGRVLVGERKEGDE